MERVDRVLTGSCYNSPPSESSTRSDGSDSPGRSPARRACPGTPRDRSQAPPRGSRPNEAPDSVHHDPPLAGCRGGRPAHRHRELDPALRHARRCPPPRPPRPARASVTSALGAGPSAALARAAVTPAAVARDAEVVPLPAAPHARALDIPRAYRNRPGRARGGRADGSARAQGIRSAGRRSSGRAARQAVGPAARRADDHRGGDLVLRGRADTPGSRTWRCPEPGTSPMAGPRHERWSAPANGAPSCAWSTRARALSEPGRPASSTCRPRHSPAWASTTGAVSTRSG